MLDTHGEVEPDGGTQRDDRTAINKSALIVLTREGCHTRLLIRQVLFASRLECSGFDRCSGTFAFHLAGQVRGSSFMQVLLLN